MPPSSIEERLIRNELARRRGGSALRLYWRLRATKEQVVKTPDIPMHVLHICGDYPYTKLYRELLLRFVDNKQIAHTMYVPLSTRAEYSDHCSVFSDNVKVICSRDFYAFERFIYHRKVAKTESAIRRQVPLSSVDLIHAHYLFSAGGIAYRLKHSADIDYIVAVRNSDLNDFFGRAIHLRRFGVKILESASKVIFIAPAYRETLLRKYIPERLHQNIREKSVVLPNGIDDFWFENRRQRPAQAVRNSLKLVFVGEWTKNRNIPTSILVTRALRDRGYNAHLTIVGGGPEKSHVKKAAAENAEFITVHDWSTKEQLLQIYRQNDVFLMPSFHDTFGLVYIEALSQGLPLIYTRGEGIDGYFLDSTVGYACNPRDPMGIVERIVDILKNYERMSATAVESIDDFSWRHIARQYEDIYLSLCR